jgi:hypothetical protein
MLTQMPEYQRLSRKEKDELQTRVMKVYIAHDPPERGAALDRVYTEIERELRAGNGGKETTTMVAKDEKKKSELVGNDVTRALKFAREEDAKRAADPIGYHEALVKREQERTQRLRCEDVHALDLAQKLTAELQTPKASIEAKAGALETFAPLFRGTGASPQDELFPEGIHEATPLNHHRAPC